ncbi:MAG: hypothetical protein CMK59_01060 [Proteobacteria bacterium]|nr:hypothetical protein [Pseudomonadota bacterium]
MSFLGKCGLAIGGVLVGLVLAEAGARLWKPAADSDLLFNSPESSPQGLYVLDKATRVIPASNFKAVAHSLGYKVNLRTNELGLRGPSVQSFEQEKPTKEEWLALGDSFTMAVQVSEENSFSGLLSTEKNIRVWNAGVDGYSTWQSAIRYRQIAQHRPLKGAVLTFFTGNDFQDNERFPHMAKGPLPGKEGAPIPRDPVPWFRKILLKYSVLYAHIRISQHRNEIASMTGHTMENWKDELSIFTKEGSGRLQRLSQSTSRALRELKSATNRSKLLVAVAPPAFVIDTPRAQPAMELVGLSAENLDLEAPQRAILNLLKQNNIPSCDLTPALKEAHKKEPVYFTFDGHWTIAGHRAVTKQLTSCLGAMK